MGVAAAEVVVAVDLVLVLDVVTLTVERVVGTGVVVDLVVVELVVGLGVAVDTGEGAGLKPL